MRILLAVLDSFTWEHRVRFCRRNGCTPSERCYPTACRVCGVTLPVR